MPAYPYPGTEESSWFPALASTFLAVALVLCDQAQTILPDDFFSHALSTQLGNSANVGARRL